ncbi:DASS family sodium-coupled anion symporter [Melioribacteraceae bacterium 4301-Me]|uniref:SLC13 family permease n=1 Tax=Pyranulibacter aquaticus TaxID=3163344 RepID=UPI00359A6C3A
MGVTNEFKLKTKHIKLTGFLLACLFFILFMVLVNFDKSHQAAKLVAGVAILMSVLWITEAIPLAVTSLIPLVLFPFLGLLSAEEVSRAYINSTIFLFMGGFLIAIAMEKWGLHKRIALNLISAFGKSPAKIIMGFMVASGFISMWISNTATAVMILPIGLAILYKLENEFGQEKSQKFSIALMLGIAYACSIGGIATLIGTPPNLVFQRIYAITFPHQQQIMFGDWMKFGVPLSLAMLILAWFLITQVFYKSDKSLVIDAGLIKSEKKSLGKMSFEEKAVAVVFILTSLLWIFRVELNLGFAKIPGWSQLFSKSNMIDDGTVAITMGVILFLIPVKNYQSGENFILSETAIRKIPWEIILLFGGGFALADGFVKSGLSELIGNQFAGLKHFPVVMLIAAVCLVIVLLTELTSNTATAQIVLPILASLSIELNINPFLLMIPATIAASMAFMLPVATPPNAIVFGSQRLKVFDMLKVGIVLDLIGVVIMTVFIYFYLS